ncbi:MAG: 50S ribosomal protein L13 [Parcubacteria group bacterium]|nr:MAG: 50S ribosomal protein L13 [Parcubacteria group bacterium]
MEREKHTLDAEGKIAGRLASRVAFILQGKHKPSYQAHTDCGDIVSVTNAVGLKFSGNKLQAKTYHRYSGYPGGIRNIKLSDLMAKNPAKAFRQIVTDMLPKNRLRKNMLKRLTIS